MLPHGCSIHHSFLPLANGRAWSVALFNWSTACVYYIHKLGKWPGWFLYLNLLICLFPQTIDQDPFSPSSVKSWNVLFINTSFSICALLGQSFPSNGASFLAGQPPLLSCQLCTTGFSSLILVTMFVLCILICEKLLTVFFIGNYCRSFLTSN